jgi:hypothetical protein
MLNGISKNDVKSTLLGGKATSPCKRKIGERKELQKGMIEWSEGIELWS